MKLRIQKVCLPKEVFEALPLSVRMIIATGSSDLKDDGNNVFFELTVGILRGPAPAAGPLYTNTYFCDRDKIEWKLTECAASDLDSCPDCGRLYMPLMTEADGVLYDHSELSLKTAFGKG